MGSEPASAARASSGAGRPRAATPESSVYDPVRPRPDPRRHLRDTSGMEVGPFRIERFYARYEHSTRFMLSSSDCQSRTVADLLELEPDAHQRMLECWCGYTESPGGPDLRRAIALLYERASAEEVVVTSCAEEGIFLLYHAVLRPGDHAIVETPCYESALEVARSTGAEVSRWERRYDDGWAHDLDALARLIRPATRLLYLNQPHNPTGTLMTRAVFEHVIGLARAHGLVVFSDEVYRELEHDPAARLPAACDVYQRAVSLGSISKSYGLPGLRIGWIATRDAALREAISVLKDYTTICASAPSEFLTALALRNRQVLLDRNLAIVRRNLPLLDAFFERHADAFGWVRPTASPIGFPRVTGAADLDGYCARLAGIGVLLLPGSVYDKPDHLRIGFGRADMPGALDLFEANLPGGQ
jgi:aspartate/methionine/tyrosine aminotransferase